MTREEYQAAVVAELIRQLGCTPEEAISEAGDVSDMQDDDLSPEDAASEIIAAGAVSASLYLHFRRTLLDVIEGWTDQNEENQDENGKLGMDPTPEQERELEIALAETFSAWRTRHGLGRAWHLAERRNDYVEELPARPA